MPAARPLFRTQAPNFPIQSVVLWRSHVLEVLLFHISFCVLCSTQRPLRTISFWFPQSACVASPHCPDQTATNFHSRFPHSTDENYIYGCVGNQQVSLQTASIRDNSCSAIEQKKRKRKEEHQQAENPIREILCVLVVS